MALSADGARVLRLVIARGLRLTAGGILLGAAAGFAQTRLLANLPGEPRLPRGILVGDGGDDDHRMHSLSPACVAGDPY